MRAWIGLLLSLVIFLNSPGVSSQSPFEQETAVKLELREAIYRYMFAKYSYREKVRVFCIAAERPLPESFLQRFANSKTTVLWASDCENSGPMNGIQQKKTGFRGMKMSILTLQMNLDEESIAKVSAFSDGISANWNTLRLRMENGYWTVVGDTLTGVS